MRLLAGIAALWMLTVPARTQEMQDPGVAEIHVDDECRILTQDRADPGDKFSRARFRRDAAVCHIESPHETKLWDAELVDGVVRRTRVTVKEQTYVLRNVFDTPLTFTVGHFVPHGWHIDSTPQPDGMDGEIALFHVQVKPGATVRLHVGVRK